MADQKLLTTLKNDLLWALQYLAIIKQREPAQAVALPISVDTMPEIPITVRGGGHPLLDKFCTAIRDYEGVPGDANYLNNNPGNCRYNPDGYLAQYGHVTESPAGFAVFPSYEIGWMYLENMILGRIHAHSNWTLLQFFENYAPSTDGNNPALYAGFVAKRLGVETPYQIKNILS